MLNLGYLFSFSYVIVTTYSNSTEHVLKSWAGVLVKEKFSPLELNSGMQKGGTLSHLLNSHFVYMNAP